MKKTIIILLVLLILTGCASRNPEPSIVPTDPTVQTQPSATESGESEQEYLFVHFIDVGQADCTLLKLGDLEILIDGGNAADCAAVYDYLNLMGVDDIELMIATHPHEDHYGGLSYVLKRVETEQLWVTTDDYINSLYNSFGNTARAQDLTLTIPAIGQVFEQDGLTLTVLGPVKDYSDQKTNNTSLVVMVQYGQIEFLFTADMESLAEADLLASGAVLSADVLKVGHHGSYTSSSTPFLEAVGAQYGVIHVGADNEYGHPHSSAMNRLQKSGITVYRTDLCGSIVIATDGTDLAFAFTDKEGIR